MKSIRHVKLNKDGTFRKWLEIVGAGTKLECDCGYTGKPLVLADNTVSCPGCRYTGELPKPKPKHRSKHKGKDIKSE